MQIILWVAGAVFLVIVVSFFISWDSLKKMGQVIGEKDANSMARAFVEITSLHLKSVIGFALIIILLLAISANIITAPVGFPFITSIATYLLASNGKDTSNNEKIIDFLKIRFWSGCGELNSGLTAPSREFYR